MRFSVALDIDDVLAQFYPAMCRRFGMPCKRFNIWDGEGEEIAVAQNFYIIENSRNFWLNLEKESRPEDIDFNVDYYLTSSPPMMKGYRKNWLTQHGFPEAPVISTFDKVSEMRKRNIDVLVDDKPATLEEVKKNGFIPIQYVPSYMSDIRDHLNPIRHLSQVPEVLGRL